MKIDNSYQSAGRLINGLIKILEGRAVVKVNNTVNGKEIKVVVRNQ